MGIALTFFREMLVRGFEWSGRNHEGTGNVEREATCHFRTNDDTGDWWDSEALSITINDIFVPMTEVIGCLPTQDDSRIVPTEMLVPAGFRGWDKP